MYFVLKEQNNCVCTRASEKLKQLSTWYVQLHKWIASSAVWSLTNFNRLSHGVGRVCRRLSESSMSIIITTIFYYYGLRLVELNSQMAPSLSQICVFGTLTMSSFALEARKGCTGHVNPWFLQQRRSRDQRTALLLPLSVRLRRSQHTSFVFFSLWTSVTEIEVLNEKDCSLGSMLYCESL